MGGKVFKLFSETDLSGVLRAEENIFKRKIDKINKSNQEIIIKNYYKKHYFEPLEIDFDDIEESQYINKRINMLFYVYCIPFKGNPELLRYSPSDGISGWTLKVYNRPGYLCFEKETFINHPGDFKEEVDEIMSVIKQEVEKINRDIGEYNKRLRKYFEEKMG